MLLRWKQIGHIVREFQSLLAPQVPSLEVQEGINCQLDIRNPELKNPGVYFIFNEHETLKYVGSATNQRLLDRIRAYLKPDTPLKVTPRYIDIVPFDWKWAFFAPALELYMIQKVVSSRSPGAGEDLLNKVGVIAGIRERLDQTHQPDSLRDETTSHNLPAGPQQGSNSPARTDDPPRD